MAKKEKKYVALIGDLVASRAMEPAERARVQERFQATLDKINKKFKEEIASLFLITAGDETQGILHRSDYGYEILRQIQIELKPTEIVFGVGYGPLTTDIGEYAVGADGPAFYLARQALTEAKNERKAYGKSIIRDVRFQSDNEHRDKVLNALFLALAVIKNQWTEKQAEVLNLLEQGQTPSDVEKSLNMPLSNISRTIETSYFREFESIVDSLRMALHTTF